MMIKLLKITEIATLTISAYFPNYNLEMESYTCVFIGKINEIYILINEKSNRKILGFWKISRDRSQAIIERGYGN